VRVVRTPAGEADVLTSDRRLGNRRPR
jgi:hypothetical protein